MAEKIINSRIVHKHDTEENWSKATTFIPKAGEFVIYDADAVYWYPRIKVGDGVTTVVDLPFIDESIIVDSKRVTHDSDLLFNILETYVLNIDYDTLLAFDTTEIVTGATSTTSVLGQAILGQMVLA